MTNDQELPANVIAALEANHKIEAIKLLREHYGCGLKEAKEIVEAYEFPESSGVTTAEIRAETGIGRLVLILIISAAIYGVYTWLR